VYAAIVREDRQRRMARRVPTSRARASHSRDSNTDAATKTNKPQRDRLLKKKGRVYGAKSGRDSVITPERTSSLGKSTQEWMGWMLLMAAT